MDGSVASRRLGPPRSGIAERIWDAARPSSRSAAITARACRGSRAAPRATWRSMYRHWASKRALYVDILRAVWIGSANEIARLLEAGLDRAGRGGGRLRRRDDGGPGRRANPDPRVPRRRPVPRAARRLGPVAGGAAPARRPPRWRGDGRRGSTRCSRWSPSAASRRSSRRCARRPAPSQPRPSTRRPGAATSSSCWCTGSRRDTRRPSRPARTARRAAPPP